MNITKIEENNNQVERKIKDIESRIEQFKIKTLEGESQLSVKMADLEKSLEISQTNQNEMTI